MNQHSICYSVPQAAKLLGIGRTKAYALVKANQIPHVRIGRRILVPKQGLQLWLHEQTNVQK